MNNTKDKPCKVSVVCTVYNHEPYLRQTLDGFVSQKTDFPFEVLISDDVSTDGSVAILQEYARRYPEIIRLFLLKENHYSRYISLYDAVLYPEVRGEYIAICEGDDCWTDPDKLQLQVDYLDAHPDCSACVHNSTGQIIGSKEEPKPLFPRTGDRDIPFELVLQGMSHAFHTSSILARREYLLNPPDFHDVAFRYNFTDYAVGIWLTMQGRVRFLDRCMSLYRIGSNPSSWSSNVNRNYAKLIRFVTGEREMLRALRPHVDEPRQALVDQVILEREFELLYLKGKTSELVKPPYRELFRAKPFSFRTATRVKNALPHLHRWYRKKRGYED